MLQANISSRQRAWAASCRLSSSVSFGLPRLYSTGTGRYSPSLPGIFMPLLFSRNSTTSHTPRAPKVWENIGIPLEIITPPRFSSKKLSCALSCNISPSIVRRFSSHCCSICISAHCLRQNAKCCIPESGRKSSSA